MAMTQAGLSAAIKAGIVAKMGTPASDTLLQEFCDGIAQGIVPYLTANMQVNSGIAVATTGSASAQTGSTTAPGTVS